MARIFITGSADGLGRAAAETLLEDGHEVIVHARSTQRLTAVNDLINGGASPVAGDLADFDQTRACSPPSSIARNGWCTSAAVRTVAGVDWSGQRRTGSYSDSKLFVTTLAVAIARIWPDVYSNAVDPGWVPTRMGGPGAPDDLRLGHPTQEWLATSDQ